MERLDTTFVITHVDVRLTVEEVAFIRKVLGKEKDHYALFRDFANLDDYLRKGETK